MKKYQYSYLQGDINILVFAGRITLYDRKKITPTNPTGLVGYVNKPFTLISNLWKIADNYLEKGTINA